MRERAAAGTSPGARRGERPDSEGFCFGHIPRLQAGGEVRAAWQGTNRFEVEGRGTAATLGPFAQSNGSYAMRRAAIEMASKNALG